MIERNGRQNQAGQGAREEIQEVHFPAARVDLGFTAINPTLAVGFI